MKNNLRYSQRGSAMLIGLIFVLLISALVISYHRISMTQDNNIQDFSRHQRAQYVARSGLLVFNYKVKTQAVDVPVVKDAFNFYQGTIGDGNYYVTMIRISATALNTTPPFTDEDLVGIYELTSTGIVEGQEETFRSVLKVTTETNYDLGLNMAIVTEGDLEIAGDPNILESTLGALADVHSNGDVLVQGSVNADGKIAASGTLTLSGTSMIIEGEPVEDTITYETINGGADKLTLPKASARDYEARADYKLVSNGINSGMIYVAATKTYVDPGTLNWNYNSGRQEWTPVTVRGVEPPEAFYFSDGNVNMSDQNLGTSLDPFKMTLATTQNFQLNGGSVGAFQDDLCVIADLDIQIIGNAGAGFNGIFLANEQIDFSGTSSTKGMLISTGLGNTSNLATVNKLSGTMNFNSGDNLKMPNTSKEPIMSLSTKQTLRLGYNEAKANLKNFTIP
jgi:hypothetical protein